VTFLPRLALASGLFFDSGPEDRYAELFINVDAKKRVLEFHEKDEDYRKPLLLALTKAPCYRPDAALATVGLRAG
jgi:hypothetical protein